MLFVNVFEIVEDVCGINTSPETDMLFAALHTKLELTSATKFNVKAVSLHTVISGIGLTFGKGLIRIATVSELIDPQPFVE